MSGDWLNKLTPEQPGVGCGEKNGNIAPDDERMTLDGRAMRSTE